MKSHTLKMVGIILTILTIFCFKVNAQTKLSFNPFHRMAPQHRYLIMMDSTGSYIKPIEITAYRFTGPMAGFDLLNNKVVTGVGFGWQKLHYVDSTNKYYTDFSVSAVALAGGSAIPSFEQNNIVSVGVGFGLKNQLIMIIPCYNLPLIPGTKGRIGLVLCISATLNN